MPRGIVGRKVVAFDNRLPTWRWDGSGICGRFQLANLAVGRRPRV